MGFYANWRTSIVEGAINWLEKNQDTPLDELEAEDASPSVNAEAVGEGQVAQSIVCNDCGKKFRTKQLAGFHAEKTYVTSGPQVSLCTKAIIADYLTYIVVTMISPNQLRNYPP